MLVPVLFFLPLCLNAARGNNDDTFTLSGTVTFTKTGPLFISLVDEENFLQDREDPPFALIIQLDDSTAAAGQTAFSFENVPAGIWGIIAFQDVNENSTLDMGLLGPKEPYGFSNNYRPRFGPPRFKRVSFEVDRNIDDILIHVK